MKKFLTLAPAIALALAGCAGSSDSPDDADVTFAQMMIPHHQQAIDMAEVALDDEHDAGAEVRDLATRVEAAQGPEIEQLNDWLTEWDADSESEADHGGHEAMTGMMSEDQMAELEQATGTAFDRLWLAMMIEHHEGAVTMAEDVLAEGSQEDVAALAQEIIDAQQSEITEMEALLDD